MNRIIVFCLFGLLGCQPVLFAAVPPVIEQKSVVNQQQPVPQPSLFSRLCTKIGTYVPSSGQIKSAVNQFIPSKKTIAAGALVGSVLTWWTRWHNERNIYFLEPSRIGYAHGIMHAMAGLMEGTYIADNNGHRCYYLHDPLRYMSLSTTLMNQELLEQFITECGQFIQKIEAQDQNKNDENTRSRGQLLTCLRRFCAVAKRCKRLAVQVDDRSRNDELIQEALNFERNINILKTIIDVQVDTQKKAEKGDQEAQNTLMEILCDSLNSAVGFEKDLNKLRKHLDDAERVNQPNPVSAPGHPQLKEGWSSLNATLAMTKSIAAAYVFPRLVACAGSIGVLHHAGSLAAMAAAKPGAVGLAALLGCNCATVLGSMATAYVLQQALIKPVIKPLIIRLACAVAGKVYNPQHAHAQ